MTGRYFWGAWTVGGVKVTVTSAGKLVGGFAAILTGGPLGDRVVTLPHFRTGKIAKATGIAHVAALGLGGPLGASA